MGYENYKMLNKYNLFIRILQFFSFLISPERIINLIKRNISKYKKKKTKFSLKDLANFFRFLPTAKSNYGLIKRIRYSSFEKKLIDSNLKLFNKYSMVSYGGLVYTFNLTLYVVKNKIAGDIVETGCWKGGSAAAIYFALKQLNSNKKIYLYDSFMGLPNLTKKDLDDKSNTFNSKNLKREWKVKDDEFSGKMRPLESSALKAELNDINHLFFKLLKAKKSQVIINQGWFIDSFQNAESKKIKKISLLRLDADLYESTKIALDTFYTRVQNGGVIIIDDYSIPGCKKACHDFFNKNSIKPLLIPIDAVSAFFIKMK